MSHKKPLVGVEPGIDVVWQVVRKDCRDGGNSVIGKRETPLCRSGHQFGGKGASSTEDRDIGHRGSVDSHWGLEVFPSRGGDIDVVGVNGDIVVERGKKKGVEYFLSYAGGCRRHG